MEWLNELPLALDINAITQTGFYRTAKTQQVDIQLDGYVCFTVEEEELRRIIFDINGKIIKYQKKSTYLGSGWVDVSI